MAAPVTLVDENGRLYTTQSPLFVSFPLDLMTDAGDGQNRRLRVDPGQTGFFAGKEFRSFYEFDLSDGQTAYIKAVVPIDVILRGVSVNLLEGELRLSTYTGGTEAGTFATPVPTFGRNNMESRPEPFYTRQVALTTGGTHSGGTLLDVLVDKTSDNANFSASVGASNEDERGIAPGTYYFHITATGTTRGVMKARWEERP